MLKLKLKTTYTMASADALWGADNANLGWLSSSGPLPIIFDQKCLCSRKFKPTCQEDAFA